MIESWILAKLERLNGSPVIIFRDPQRMVIPGARVVDGWAEENDYTVFFCTGNLALREMYEPVREGSETKLLLVDQSREGSLFYPDLEVRAGKQNVLPLSLRDFLIEQTGDTAWPKLVERREISRIILENLPQALQAYQDLRRAAPHRFSDSDLYKVAMGGALKINPFKRLSPGEIRRLCIEQHARLESLNDQLPSEVMATVKQEVARAPRPFCWLLERDPDQVMRAFTLAAILRQHRLDHRLLLGNIDPLLYDYKEIDPEFLDQAIQELLTAEPDQMLDDVHSVEEMLKKSSDGLALILHEQLHLEDPNQALAVLKCERLSKLVLSLALASLLTDLILNKNLDFHRQALQLLDAQEKDPALPALRRPGTQWLNLVSTYRRAFSVFELTAVLGLTVKQLKVAATGELDFSVFHKAWNEDRLNRLDYYLSDLDRSLRVADILPLPVAGLWPELQKDWEAARQAFHRTLEAARKAQNFLDSRFQDFYRQNYTKWLERSDIPVVFTHQFLPRVFQAHWDPQKAQKAIILVFDGMRTDAFDEFLRPVLEERYALIGSLPGSAILPTETNLSRKAISAGKLPADFQSGSQRESDLLQAWLKDSLGWAPDFEILQDNDSEASGMVVRYVSSRLEYIVFDFTDANLHHNQNDLALIYRSVVREIIEQDVRGVLRGLPEDALIFVTSDHGFSPVPKETIGIPSDLVVDDHDVKYRNARAVKKPPLPDSEKVVDFDVRVMGIPKTSLSVKNTPVNYVLFPRPGFNFKRARSPHDPDRYSHGGLSMAECLVPMAVFGPRQENGRLLEIQGLRQVGSAGEGEVLELEILVQAVNKVSGDLAFTLSFNRDEIPTRKEIFSGPQKTVTVRWTPQLGEITPEARDRGVVELPVAVQLSYRVGERFVRSSRVLDVRVRLDTTRLRRRLDSKLDLLMGKVPRELKS